ncbi:MAG: GWxTD domain-containing protein [Marinilabiliales bacterium]|nr:GWxTD domain-containing protein [Marinilabiliales bacterium]
MTLALTRKTAAAVPALAALGQVLLLAAGIAAASACGTYKLEKKLGPAHSDFLSQVGYIITKEERKIFLELPADGRDDFIAEFWARRDPDTDTAVNEYRLEYEDRVKKAALMFHGEGRPGWLTDRGRILILFGPPSERQTNPMDLSGNCRELWYYGSFPVIFIDEHCSGNFILRAINLEHLQELNIAQGHFQKTFAQDKKLFDYLVSMQKTRVDETAFEGKVFVDIPYNTIWFTFKDGRLETSFDVRVEISDESGTPDLGRRGRLPPGARGGRAHGEPQGPLPHGIPDPDRKRPGPADVPEAPDGRRGQERGRGRGTEEVRRVPAKILGSG